MSSNTDYMPRLRNVEPVRLIVEDREVIGLRDPLQLRDETVCVSREAVPVLALFDGRHSLRDIQTELTRMAGRLVFTSEIEEMLVRLDEAFLLDGDRFRQAFDRKVAEYRKKPYREASHAGLSYSEDPGGLSEELEGFFKETGSPGRPDLSSEPYRAVGLIAPHIDIRAGAGAFARAYHALASGVPSDVYVIFGTGHSGVSAMFTATNLDFLTPLGTVRTDRDFLDRLGRELGRDPAAEEILHAKEHVIEFQVVFLQHVFAGRHDFTIVPILCSLSHEIFREDASGEGGRLMFDEFCAAVRETCKGRSVCFIASADLDHIGPRYGDRSIPHRGTVADAMEKDAELMSCLERIDVNGFVKAVARDNDARRICGFSPITAMMNCMEASGGKLLALDFARVDDRNSFVSFASMIFH